MRRPHANPPCGGTGLAVTIHPIATDAAVRVMARGERDRRGGRGGLMLGVVDGHNSGIGGGCFMLVRLADGRVFALDGREMGRPRRRETCSSGTGRGTPRCRRSGRWPGRAGVAGGVPVCDGALRAEELADLLEPAAEVAERGFRSTRRTRGN